MIAMGRESNEPRLESQDDLRQAKTRQERQDKPRKTEWDKLRQDEISDKDKLEEQYDYKDIRRQQYLLRSRNKEGSKLSKVKKLNNQFSNFSM